VCVPQFKKGFSYSLGLLVQVLYPSSILPSYPYNYIDYSTIYSDLYKAGLPQSIQLGFGAHMRFDICSMKELELCMIILLLHHFIKKNIIITPIQLGCLTYIYAM
jgi:hypothetical protein